MKLLFIYLLLLPIQLIANNPVRWTARWITHPELELQSHAVVLFRKSFDLTEKPDSFIVHVSADNHYRLFVNGKYVLRGPARGDLAHWFYETVDIADYLASGKNVIAAEVINWGPKRSFSFFSQMTSFILQGNSETESVVNTSGSNWKCLHNKAIYPKNINWMLDRSTIDFGLYVGNPTDSINGNDYPWGWESTNYNDSSWLPAKWADVAGGRGTQYAGGILYSGGKLLVPRKVPILKEEPVTFVKIRRTNGIEKNENFIKGTGVLVIPKNQKISILIDQTHMTMGYPEMLVSGGKNAKIQAMYAENLIVGNKLPRGSRNDIEGKYMVGIKDIFIPDGGEKRLLKPSYIRAFRFIQLDIETENEPLTLEKYYQVECKAPLTLQASFDSGNELTDWIMDTGWRTVSMCAQDYLMSDAYYEQMQYTGDSRVHNLALLTLSGDDRLTRNALVQFDQSRIPEGLTYACYPNAFHLVIPSYSLIWIDQIYDYMMWKDDKEFIAQFDLGIQSVLHWFEQRMQPNGLIGKMEWWGALAWPRHYKSGQPPGFYDGNNTLYSLHYAYTLNHAADIYEYLGKTSNATEYRNQANEICSSVNRLCKNSEGFYTESPDSKQVSHITNLMAILAESVTGTEAIQLMKKLLEQRDCFGQVDLFLHLYLFEAMIKTGLQDHFLSELSEWQLMKESGMTTFAEIPLEWEEENQRSECHPWSSSPNHFLFRTICGIKPLEAGHRTVEIAPCFGELNEINAVYPNHHGNIELRLKKIQSELEGEIIIPEGISATLLWNGKKLKLFSGKNRLN
jgi:hypothetical protein